MRVICEVPTYGRTEEGKIEEGVTLRIMNNSSAVSPYILIETPETVYQVKAADLLKSVQCTRTDLNNCTNVCNA